MDVGTWVERFRSEILDDELEPYLWSDTNIINYLNDTIDECAEENLVITDQSTTSVTTIKLLSNTTLHAISDSIVHIRFGRLESTGYGVVKTTEDWLNAEVSDWRDTEGTDPTHFAPSAMKGYLSIYPRYNDTYYFAGSSNISFTAATKTISQATGDFSGLAIGDEVNISGTTNNNGYFTVVTVGTTSFTISETVTTESNTSAVIKKVEDKLLLTVNRMPLTPFTVADIAAATDITDLKAIHHAKLFNGVAKRAFLKPDSETYDKGKSEYHRQLFEKDKRRMKITTILGTKPDKTRKARSGTSIWY
jgi:hypothetical protein